MQLTEHQKSAHFIEGPEYPDLFDGMTPIIQQAEAVCIGCDCTDSHACQDGCYWMAVNYEAGIGACSNCPAWADIVTRLESITSDRRIKCKRCGEAKVFLQIETPQEVVHLFFCERCLW